LGKDVGASSFRIICENGSPAIRDYAYRPLAAYYPFKVALTGTKAGP